MKKFIVRSAVNGEQEVIIDSEDWDKVKLFKWHAVKGHSGNIYIKSHLKKGSKVKVTPLHRFILDCNYSNCVVDHKNGNSLDNRKRNLRICTSAQNSRNRKLNCDNTSGFKGVVMHKQKQKYMAQIGVDGKNIFLGYHETKEDAARKYNIAAKKYHGKFARINEISRLL